MPETPPPIQELPENVVHKIAAGEVVERPVSVVKELVENAIDAGAQVIHVAAQKGGMDSIVVTDDGHGIPPQQMNLALKRHATSKIHSAEDLFSLHTLGFRGEALPSIASVSEFRIESATAETDPLGYALEVREGKVSQLKETPLTRGTRVEVKNLFCTTPARRKFLKRPETEWGHIADLMTALALSRLDIEWKLEHNGKVLLFCPIATDPARRVLDVFGKDAMENLFPMEKQVSEIGIWGLLGHPNFSKRSNRHLFVFVNGRYVQDRLINHAIVTGYRSLLMTGQYPMVILHLNLAPSLVDVNVHPAKREIKFSNSNAMHHLISEAIHQELERAPWQGGGDPVEVLGESTIRNQSDPREGDSASNPVKRGFNYSGAKGETLKPREGNSLAQVYYGGVPRPNYPARNLILGEGEEDPKARIGTLGFSSLQLIGQFQGTYLICEHEGSLILIDQHAAHERIGFEAFRKAYRQGDMGQQRFLTPITFNLPPGEAARLKTCLEELEQFGLVVDEFGENTFVIKAHPTLIKNCDWVKLIQEVLEKMEDSAKTQGLEDKINHVLATMACHRQIRAHHRLDREEMEELLRQLSGTPRSYHCPHGRPVMVEIEAREIEKWFKRVL